MNSANQSACSGITTIPSSSLAVCAAILTSNRSFKEWGQIFGDNVVAAALLDRLLHHAVVIQIEGNSYRLRAHAGLLPEALVNPQNQDPQPKPRRGRPPKDRS